MDREGVCKNGCTERHFPAGLSSIPHFEPIAIIGMGEQNFNIRFLAID